MDKKITTGIECLNIFLDYIEDPNKEPNLVFGANAEIVVSTVTKDSKELISILETTSDLTKVITHPAFACAVIQAATYYTHSYNLLTNSNASVISPCEHLKIVHELMTLLPSSQFVVTSLSVINKILKSCK